MLAPKELKEVHPLGKSPVIGVQNANTDKPLILAESGFIAEYLCDHFNGEHLVPKRYKEGKEGQVGGETDEWLRFRYFMHYAEGSLMPLLVIQLIMNSEFFPLSRMLFPPSRVLFPSVIPQQGLRNSDSRYPSVLCAAAHRRCSFQGGIAVPAPQPRQPLPVPE